MPSRALALRAAGDALSVVCDQLDELADKSSLHVCVILTSLCAARAYRAAGLDFASAGAADDAALAFAGASAHYARAGYTKNAATMRDRALGGRPATMSISLNGRLMDVELPVLPRATVKTRKKR